MPDNNEDTTRNVFVAFVGSRPLVVYLDNWKPGTIELVTFEGEQVTYQGENVTAVV